MDYIESIILGCTHYPILLTQIKKAIDQLGYDANQIDKIMLVSQDEAEESTRRLAREEGIFAGVSSGGALAAALHLSSGIENSVIVFIACDRGDRYLSTGIFLDK